MGEREGGNLGQPGENLRLLPLRKEAVQLITLRKEKQLYKFILEKKICANSKGADTAK